MRLTTCFPADDMYVLSTRQRRLPVELVGKRQIEARQKELQHLRVASLAYTGVSSAGPPGQFQSLVPSTFLHKQASPSPWYDVLMWMYSEVIDLDSYKSPRCS